MNRIKKLYKDFRLWEKTVWSEKSIFKVSIFEKIKWALKGFSVNESVWYELKKNDYREYISEYDRLRSREINGPYKFILDDKLIFEEVVGKYVKVPTNYAWVKNGTVYGLHGNGMSNENLIECLKKYQTAVLKWNGSGGGEGTYVIAYINDKFIVNGQEFSEDSVQSLFARNGSAILCEYITQSLFASSLFPHTTNTIRIVCAKKSDEEKAQFVTAIQRVGCIESIPVDNVSRGGLTLDIDEKTGELGPGIAKYGKKENIMIPFDKHPDTGEIFVGKKIPGWSDIVNQMVSITNLFPYLNFVAWDILLTEDGFCVIEGNASSGCGIFQMKRGVRNSKLGDIYRSYKIF